MDINSKILEGIIRVTERYPYFTRLINRIELREINKIPTIMIDTKYLVMSYNSDFINNLSNNEIDFVILHELLHVVHGHGDRFIKDKSFEMNNTSMDLEINSVIDKVIHYGSKLPGGLYPKDFNLPELKTHEWYIENIPEENESNDSDDNSKNHGNSNSDNGSNSDSGSDSSQDSENDNGDPSNSSPESGNSSSNSIEKSLSDSINKLVDIVINNNDRNSDECNREVSDKLRNSINSSINEIINELNLDKNLIQEVNKPNECEDVGDPLEDEIDGIKGRGLGSCIRKNKLRKVIKYFSFVELLKKLSKENVLNKYDYSYSKMSRRSQDSSIIFPGKFGLNKNKYVIAIIFDVSGSFYNYIEKVTNSLINFYKKYKLTYMLDIDILICDSASLDPIPIEEFSKDKISYYGGGTCLFNAYEKCMLNKKQYSDIIMITDGCDDFSNFKKYNKRCFVALPYECRDIIEISINIHNNKNLIPVILKDI